MADTQEIYGKLLASRYQEQLFSGLPGERKLEKGGRETLVDCPFCGKEGHFSYSSSKPLWKCWNCGKTGDWLSYLEQQRRLSFMEALQLLAKEAGVDLKLSQAYQQKHQAYVRKAEILEAAQAILAKDLTGGQLQVGSLALAISGQGDWLYKAPVKIIDIQEQAGQRYYRLDDPSTSTYFEESQIIPAGSAAAAPVIEYLTERGYSYQDWQAMELGAHLDPQGLRIELLLLGYDEREIKEAGLLAPAWQSHPLTLLYRDPAGRAIGLAGRSILSRAEAKAKKVAPYHYSAGLEKASGLIGLESVRGAEQLLLVEGLLDALYLNSLGLQAVAIGGTDLSAAQIKAIQANGTKELLLSLDMDPAGQKATEKAISSLRLSKLRAYVVSLPAGYKDPDELVRDKGLAPLQEAMAKAEAWPKWLAKRLLQQHDLKTDIGLDRALEEALAVYSDLMDDKLEARAFWEAMRATTGLSEEELLQRASQTKQTATQKRLEQILSGIGQSIQAKAGQGDILGAETDILAGIQQLREARGAAAPEPYLLEDLERDISSLGSGLATGWSSLDLLAKIPQGALTLIGGRPGQGKTTLQLNLLANWLKAYPAKSFYFFSYEEARSWLAVKLIMAMAGKVLSPGFNLEAYLHYIREQRATQPDKQIEQAIQTYQAATSSGRLLISDRRLPAEDLAATIGYLAQREELGAVLIDYIQKVGLRRPEQQRYVEVKRVSDLLLEQAVRTGLPLILGAQLGRAQGKSTPVSLDNLRESGDLEQDANLVLGIHNKTQEEAELAGRSVTQQTVDLQVTVLKNRAGVSGKACFLEYNMPAYQIKDKNPGSSLA